MSLFTPISYCATQTPTSKSGPNQLCVRLRNTAGTILALWLGFLSIGFAQQPWPPVYEIRKDTGVYPIDTAHFQVLEDRAGNLTFEQVQRSSAFRFDSHYNPTRQTHVCWLRMQIKNGLDHDMKLYLCEFKATYFDLYTQASDGRWHHQRTGELIPRSQLPVHNGGTEQYRLFLPLRPGEQITLYQRSENPFWYPFLTNLTPELQTEENRIHSTYTAFRVNQQWKEYFFEGIMIGMLFLAVCYNLYIYFSIKDKVYLYFAICLLFFNLDRNGFNLQLALFPEQPYLYKSLQNFFFLVFYTFFIQAIRNFIQPTPDLSHLNRAITFFLVLLALTNVLQFFMYRFSFVSPVITIAVLEIVIRVIYVLLAISMVKMIRHGSLDARFALLATAPLFTFWLFTLATHLVFRLFSINLTNWGWYNFGYYESACFAWLIVFFSGALLNRYNLARKRVAQQAIEKEQLEKEREMERSRIIASQNERLEQQVKERTSQLQTSLENLRATQDQLVQKEKLASLGELTAGIAHEIQNPLNFVNNFSEVSTELLTELEEEQQKPERDPELEKELLGDLKLNLQKISHHGNRASHIVQSMLAHSRNSTGERQASNLNQLCDEYLRLAYHGLRAKDNTFNCELVTDLDPNPVLVRIIPQEIGRVLLNLFNNAFYTVQEKQKRTAEPYQPAVTVATRFTDRQVEIRVIDNGMGMTDAVKAKLFQPFFTTKPTGEGTGLGLSLSYDIVTKSHGGSLTVESQPGQGSAFILVLPVV
ncbi:phospho-acceptor domain-containing protein [Larkinella arboricola]|uniref:histidine kinase n=1 Tax=Larkinella arboricola TaxID=643671 RepID=A0A327WWL8_LARAB|nr:phospho-acceptor domain-containing protein [Larkinella arboricola]